MRDIQAVIAGKTGYLFALVLSTIPALVALPWYEAWDNTNLAMLFLLQVVVSALWLGRGPAIVCAVSGILLFDVLFVPPRFSLTVHDAKYVVTFIVMLLVALVISYLASTLRQQMLEALLREKQTRALYEFASRLTGVLSRDALIDILREFVRDQINGELLLLLLTDDEKLVAVVDDARLDATDLIAAQAAFHRTGIVETHSLCCGERSGLFVSLVGATRRRGVLGVILPHRDHDLIGSLKPLVQAACAIAVTALERLHFVEVANVAEQRMAAERMRSSILSALSHDIRTPLAALYGLADSLTLNTPSLPEQAQETISAMRAQVLHMNSLATNLLEMARLQSGKITLNKEWQPLEEVVGASIKQLQRVLAGRRIGVVLPDDLPLLEFDAVLIERVFCNLLENAAKYSTPDSDITIDAAVENDAVCVRVVNSGSSFPVDNTHSMFDVFARGEHATAIAGTGIGLAICRVIIDAHGGEISAFNLAPDKVCVTFSLPRGVPPIIETEGLSAGNSARGAFP